MNRSVSDALEAWLETKLEAMVAPVLAQMDGLRADGREDEAWAAARAAIRGLGKQLLAEQRMAALRRLVKLSEKLDPRQLELLAAKHARIEAEEAEAGEEVEGDREDDLVDGEVEELIAQAEDAEPRPKRSGRRKLPDHLPRELRERDVAPEELTCPCCGAERVEIGREVREVLDVEPVRLKVARYERIKRACPSCKDSGVVVGPPADDQLERVLASPRLLAHVTSCKYDAHLPLEEDAAAVPAHGPSDRELDPRRVGRADGR